MVEIPFGAVALLFIKLIKLVKHTLTLMQRPQESMYERTFKVENDYCPKLHRDDRQHKVGLDLYSEVVLVFQTVHIGI